MTQTRLTRRAALAGAAALAFAPPAMACPSRPPLWFDGLSFLPDELYTIDQTGLGGMICDVSEIREIRDANRTPRYLRDYETNLAALDKAVARLDGDPHAFVALKGSDIDICRGCATFLQFQSCEPVGTDLSRLAMFHGKGLRVLQFTHHNDTLFAGGALERVQSGLTDLGREGLAEMNRLRLLPDVSHGSEPTMLEVARRSTTPIALSHGACKAIVDHPRCASDEVIRAIADKGGVMGIFMMSFWLTRDPVPRIDHLIAQIRHVVRVGGSEAVGIANDFPMSGQANLVKLGNDNAAGVKEYLPWWQAMQREGIPGFDTLPQHVVIPELNDIDRMATIARALDKAGFRSRQVERIMGGNWQRLMVDVLG